MKGLVLAGGSGTRLRPITHTSAKQLVPVANRPILFFVLDHLAEVGITEVGVVLGRTGQEVRDAVGDGSQWGLSITYIQQETPAGIAHGVKIAKDFLGTDDFVLYLGDNLLRSGIRSQTERFLATRDGSPSAPAAQILLASVPDPHRFGVAELNEDGSVRRLIEKPIDPPSDLALVGVYWFDARIHEVINELAPSARGELEITEAIQGLIDRAMMVSCDVVDGYWKDLGELDALLEGNRLLLESVEPTRLGKVDDVSRIEGRVQIGEGAIIENSTVRGPVSLGKDVVVRDAYVGPFTSIGDGCQVIESEIEHSVVLSNSRLIGVGRIEDSLIGKDVEMTRSGRKPRALRVMVGDHSRIDTSWG